MSIKLLPALGLLVLAGCSGTKPPAVPTSAPVATSTQSSTQRHGWGLPESTSLSAPSLVASARPVVLVSHGTYGRETIPPNDQLGVAVWSDGRVVWGSGGSLRYGQINPNRIDELLQRLHREGVFGDGKAEYSNLVPDGDFEVIKIRLPDRELRLESCHDLFEQHPKLVASSHGIESLDGRTRDEVLAAQPAEYLRFRRIWSDIRSTVSSWMPASGELYGGPNPLFDTD